MVVSDNAHEIQIYNILSFCKKKQCRLKQNSIFELYYSSSPKTAKKVKDQIILLAAQTIF